MNGLKTEFHFDDSERLVIERVQDCTPILEFAKAQHREGYHGSSDMKLAAKIPNVVIEKFCNLNNITIDQLYADQALLARFLNDPAISDLRIWKGRV